MVEGFFAAFAWSSL